MAKRRTPAQIRATKKLVALNKARGRSKRRAFQAYLSSIPQAVARKRNPSASKKKAKKKAASQMKRGDRSLAKWVRGGMKSNPEKNKLVTIKTPKGWIKAAAVRVVRRGGKNVVEVKR